MRYAKDRLLMMADKEGLYLYDNTNLKKELYKVIEKYYDLSEDNYDIVITIKAKNTEKR